MARFFPILLVTALLLRAEATPCNGATLVCPTCAELQAFFLSQTATVCTFSDGCAVDCDGATLTNIPGWPNPLTLKFVFQVPFNLPSGPFGPWTKELTCPSFNCALSGYSALPANPLDIHDLIFVYNTALTIRGFEITHKGGGAAVYMGPFIGASSFLCDHNTFRDIVMTDSQGSIGDEFYGYHGAAIRTRGTESLAVNDCSGITDPRNSVTIMLSEFINNTAPNGRGGAIDLLYSDITISNTAFRGNYADKSGGAIRLQIGGRSVPLQAATLTLNGGVVFEDNIAGGPDANGGAISVNQQPDDQCLSAYDIVDVGTVYRRNSAANVGGALYLNGRNTCYTATASSTFIENTADNVGGAIDLRNDADATILFATFQGNSAANGGGAMSIISNNLTVVEGGSGVDVTIGECTFENNTVTDNPVGSAIRSLQGGTVEVADSSFTGNFAGGIAGEAGHLIVMNANPEVHPALAGTITASSFYDNIGPVGSTGPITSNSPISNSGHDGCFNTGTCNNSQEDCNAVCYPPTVDADVVCFDFDTVVCAPSAMPSSEPSVSLQPSSEPSLQPTVIRMSKSAKGSKSSGPPSLTSKSSKAPTLSAKSKKTSKGL